MDNEAKLMLLQGRWDDYLRFRSLCCVETMPYARGPCWIMGLQSPDESYWLDPDAGFIGYNWPYRFNSVRPTAIPEFGHLPNLGRYTWLNRNVRTLSRIMIRPSYRGRGYATWLLQNTLELIEAEYVECLTFTDGIARILSRAGFVDYGKTGGMECNYFLWRNPIY